MKSKSKEISWGLWPKFENEELNENTEMLILTSAPHSIELPISCNQLHKAVWKQEVMRYKGPVGF